MSCPYLEKSKPNWLCAKGARRPQGTLPAYSLGMISSVKTPLKMLPRSVQVCPALQGVA